MKILIVGAGIGGLALAGFLEQCGIDFTIIEKEKNWNREGFSLGMWSNGRAILKKLGLEENFDRAIFPYHKFVVKDSRGEILKSYNLSGFYINNGLALCLLKRNDLRDWLFSKIDKAKLKMGAVLEHLDASGEKIKATFTDGSREDFDLVVGADGLHSEIRNRFFKNHEEEYTGWRAWFVSTKNKLSEANTVTEFLEPGRFINLFDAREKTLAVICMLAKHENFDGPAGRRQRLLNCFKNKKLIASILEGVKDEDLLPTDLAVVKLKKWHLNNIVLIGDAAHAFEPFGGLGSSMALEDAYVLAAELGKVKENFTILQALSAYQAKRMPRVKKALDISTKMRLWKSLKSPILRKIVNLFASLIPSQYFAKNFASLMNEEI